MFKEYLTCKKCGWVHLPLSREECENSVKEFNIFYDILPPAKQEEYYGSKPVSLEDYVKCFNCGNTYKNFRISKDGDCSCGVTIQPIMVEGDLLKNLTFIVSEIDAGNEIELHDEEINEFHHCYSFPVIEYTVINGDTVDCVLDLGFNISKKERIHLFGIEPPPIRGKDLNEKERGVKIKKFIENQLGSCEENKIIVIAKEYSDCDDVKTIGTFIVNGTDVNALLISEGLINPNESIQ